MPGAALMSAAAAAPNLGQVTDVSGSYSTWIQFLNSGVWATAAGPMGNWIEPTSLAGDYEIMATNAAGTISAASFALDTWFDSSISPTWGTDPFPETASFDIYYRHKPTGVPFGPFAVSVTGDI